MFPNVIYYLLLRKMEKIPEPSLHKLKIIVEFSVSQMILPWTQYTNIFCVLPSLLHFKPYITTNYIGYFIQVHVVCHFIEPEWDRWSARTALDLTAFVYFLVFNFEKYCQEILRRDGILKRHKVAKHWTLNSMQ